jgi:hypothetical protein
MTRDDLRNVEDVTDGAPDDMFAPPPEFYEELAKDCRCCRTCVNTPCDGVCAGGVCDQYCHCDNDYDGMNEDFCDTEEP